MEVPTDGYLFNANEITMDESAMTGESDAIKKNTIEKCMRKAGHVRANTSKIGKISKHDVPSPIILSGTKVLTGEGRMIVLVVGELSCLGKIRELITVKNDEETPLQEKLERIAKHIGKFGLYSAIAIVLILLLRFAIEKAITKQWHTSTDVP
jgi:magnesium-transporting ATPase (P-type)